MTDVPPDRPLHRAFPALARKLPHVAIATLPTPVTRATGTLGALSIKHDGATSTLYGGNKVRKLEYLLGQALSHNCQQVATFGAAGSNHATATAVHARALGLHCISFLSRQRMTPWIADNLRVQVAAGARLVWVDGDRRERERQARAVVRDSGRRTWVIPMGGSSCAGTLGYVNAGFELAAQIHAQQCPLPSAIYVPLGTMGTAVGLAIGLAANGLKLPLVAVRVVHLSVGSDALAQQLFTRTMRILRRLAPKFPALTLQDTGLRIAHQWFGDGYAHATEAAVTAMTYAADHWGLSLETTYSAKTVAALLDDVRAGRGLAASPLYWATYSDAHAGAPPVAADDARVPPPLRDYMS